MDEWAWEQLQPWLELRVGLPVGPLFCIVNGRPADGFARAQPRAPRCAKPPQTPACDGASPRTSCATHTRSRWLTSVPLIVIQRQLGHSNLGITSI
jgi:hypothetical protein